MTKAMHQILVIEDEPGIRAVLRLLLEAEQYRVIEAGDGERGEIEARTHKPDLLLVDLGLPDEEGVAVIGRVRAWSAVPIVVLSARTMESQKVAALDAGADDYVTKPFSAVELLARVRAGLRRSSRGAGALPALSLGQTQVDLARRAVVGPAGAIHLTPLEYRVLDCLARQAGMIVTSRQLLREAWGPDRVGVSGPLRVCIKGLRDKLEPDPRRPQFLVTEAGLGYRLRTSDPDEDGSVPGGEQRPGNHFAQSSST
jgi:two-component system, OmpR family, KDP operon response regulator KdpE